MPPVSYAAFLHGLADEDRAASTLVIVGEGDELGVLQSLAAALQISRQVRFIGRVGHAEVPAWLNRFDVYVAASRLDSESFGVAVLEASACALPVIVSDAGGLPEVVADGKTGLVVPREDPDAIARALRRLFDAPALRARLGASGRERVRQHYQWRLSVAHMLACYREVIAAHEQSDNGAPDVTHATRSAGLVSVIVPCRNELRHVDAFCTSLWRQRMPEGWSLEVVIADGASDDGTVERLRSMAASEPRLHIVENPKRIVSCGLNLALRRARGAVIVRMDVHTEYAADYVLQCLAALDRTGADNVGGAWHAEPDAGAGPMQRAVAAAFQSRWVAGGAASRRLAHEGWVDTVYLGCWPRATFDRHGGFDEALVRNQDDEHNLRITRGGGRVWQSPHISSVYRPRARLGQVFRQYLQYGYWKPFVMKKHGQAASARQLIPALLVAAVLLLLVLALGTAMWRPLAVLLAAYGIAIAAMTLAVAASGRGGASVLLRVPLVIVTYHFSYGIGSLIGWRDALLHGRGRERFAALTR